MDFGANVWGSHAGVSTRRDRIAGDFARMAALGFTVVRWFVFTDGRSAIVYDDRGFPAGVDAHLFADVDAALEIAGGVGIRLNLVLLDHRWMFDDVPDVLADPATGELLQTRLPKGRARILRTGRGREALFANVIAPLVGRYGSAGARADLAPHLFAFEFMNEPDFIVEEWEAHLSSHVRAPLGFSALAEIVEALSTLVHSRTSALCTMSCARLDNLWAWDSPELNLDFLQVHSYPDARGPHADRDIYGVPASSLGVNCPVVLGEFPGNAPQQHPPGASPPAWTLDDYLTFALEQGYAGAWPWSFSGTDAYGSFPEEPLRTFARLHPELVNTRAR